jgi:hypothetical protein
MDYYVSIINSGGVMATKDEKLKLSGRSKGGKVTAAKLTPEQKVVRARKGALARWGAKPLRATHKGNFKDELGLDAECYVLDDEKKPPSSLSAEWA